ncbi:hypothetical protein CCM_01821 [Cordyceps militaris CM01]|uniref:Uncharacterized protein n=1 Tax=Cordyceps militaris (strain CM01) TaxID=983644 RepID=G3J7J6_CORMM|nr:uncharacterized protein CCM_01821 [Cordyceps militaris CM01]EGX97162.1 hypothetical protein CCM_01821 [Cordyceps militaris CM01]
MPLQRLAFGEIVHFPFITLDDATLPATRAPRLAAPRLVTPVWNDGAEPVKPSVRHHDNEPARRLSSFLHAISCAPIPRGSHGSATHRTSGLAAKAGSGPAMIGFGLVMYMNPHGCKASQSRLHDSKTRRRVLRIEKLVEN